MTMIMTTEATEFAQHQVTCEHQRFSFPLRDVVMWLRGDDEDNISHSQIQATERDRMYESLESTLDDEDDDASGYEVGSEGDLAIEKRSSLPLLESICSSEADEIETGYDGDNDHDGYSIETDSLVLAAERLPHLLNHPQRFDPSSIKGRKSVQAPRRRGARVSCVLRRNAALRPSIMRAVTKEKTEEKEELGLSFRVLRSQDSLLLTKERIENEHEVASEAEDDSFIDQTTRNRASSSSSSSNMITKSQVIRLPQAKLHRRWA
ncbi:unnamed protein product [Cylindrotheca closterium]|uniref:Uncharacterized protein n=1 Tax=Cylindrotheca closterium TaxID=2856 RepID=A0AAD2FFU9_9STRA|nr:unnamed protein product [Cylindrotheca closterium]